MLNHLKSSQLIILDNFKIIDGKSIPNTYGRDANSILEDFMGANERPKDVKAIIQEIEELLDEDKPNTKKARKKLDKLRSIIDPNDYEVIKLDTLITIEEDEVD